MCNQIRSRPVAQAAFLGACAAWLTAASAQAGTVETRTPFGRIEMVEEVRTRDPGEPAIMHVATEWTKLYLHWRSADGVMTVDVIDNGWMITADIRASAGKPSCSTGANYLQYRGVAGESEIENELRTVIARFPQWCSIVSPATGADYARTLADGADDLAAAEDRLRTRSIDLFKHPPTRCLAPPPTRSNKAGPEVFMMTLDGPRPLPCRK
jgi:hypothetical protein